MSKLLDDVSGVMRLRHYSYQTEKPHIYWIRQYIFFHRVTHPNKMGAAQVEAFLTHLAVEKNGFRIDAQSGAGGFATNK